MNTPRRDEIRNRIPEPRAIEEMIAFAGDAERLLRQVLPDWADEITEEERHKPAGEITGNDVIMIRDFLANAELSHTTTNG